MESLRSASFFISGTRPQLDTVIFLWLRFLPSLDVSMVIKSTRLSKLSRGSPVPITTTLETFSPVILSMLYICSSISDTVRFLTSPDNVDAQNLQPIRHPTWEDIHTELPCLYFINTLSMTFPSCNLNKNLLVPSCFETSLVTTVSSVNPISSIFCISFLGTLVICEGCSTIS